MIVAGFGFRAAATLASLQDAFAQVGGQAQALAAPADKAAAACLTLLAQSLLLPILAVGPEALQAQDTATRADRVLLARGTGSVAEAAALAGAGPGARLLRARVVSGDRLATAALAETALAETALAEAALAEGAA